MSVRGTKRPLLDGDEQNSPEDLLLLQPVGEGESSPECVLSVQPLTDPYSSDDNSLKQQEFSGKRKEMLFSATMSGPEVLFFFDVTFTPQRALVDLTGLTVVQILHHIFTFLFGDEDNKNSSNDNDVKELRIGGKTASEIYSCHLEACPWLSWMREHDVIDMRSCSMEAWKQHREELRKHQHSRDSPHSLVIILLIRQIYEQYTNHRCSDCEEMADVFRTIHPLLQVTPYLAELRYKGIAKYTVNYHIPANLVSDDYRKVVRQSQIAVVPTCVIAKNRVGKLVIEVYDKKDAISNSTSEVKKLSEVMSEETAGVKHKGGNKVTFGNYKNKTDLTVEKHQNLTDLTCKNPIKVAKVIFEKPERETDGIFTDKNRTEAYSYIKGCVPPDCRESHLLDRMAGQHVLQLIGLAKERMSLPRDGDNVNSVGIFVKNEYVYFSRLCIDYQKLKQYEGEYHGVSFPSDFEGFVSFSNWCLDLTQSKHRIAFMVTCLELLGRKVCPII